VTRTTSDDPFQKPMPAPVFPPFMTPPVASVQFITPAMEIAAWLDRPGRKQSVCGISNGIGTALVAGVFLLILVVAPVAIGYLPWQPAARRWPTLHVCAVLYVAAWAWVVVARSRRNGFEIWPEYLELWRREKFSWGRASKLFIVQDFVGILLLGAYFFCVSDFVGGAALSSFREVAPYTEPVVEHRPPNYHRRNNASKPAQPLNWYVGVASTMTAHYPPDLVYPQPYPPDKP
jgi:hypothetical protein